MNGTIATNCITSDVLWDVCPDNESVRQFAAEFPGGCPVNTEGIVRCEAIGFDWRRLADLLPVSLYRAYRRKLLLLDHQYVRECPRDWNPALYAAPQAAFRMRHKSLLIKCLSLWLSRKSQGGQQ